MRLDVGKIDTETELLAAMPLMRQLRGEMIKDQ
jgi:hypothetical protein